jgi:hypothetical protein
MVMRSPFYRPALYTAAVWVVLLVLWRLSGFGPLLGASGVVAVVFFIVALLGIWTDPGLHTKGRLAASLVPVAIAGIGIAVYGKFVQGLSEAAIEAQVQPVSESAMKPRAVTK